MRRIFFIIAFILIFLPSISYGEDMVIKKISVEGLYSIDKEELLYLLDIKEGSPIDRESLRRGIKRAFLKGIFEDIEIEAEADTIYIKVKEREFIEDISIKGEKHIREKDIKDAIPLKEGGLMRYDLIERSASIIKAILSERGYPEAKVSITTKKKRHPYRVDLKINIEAGSPSIIKEIRVYGMPTEEILPYIGLGIGDRYDQQILKEHLSKLEKRLVEDGYFKPIVGPYTFKDGVLDINISLGRRLIIAVEGNLNIGTKTILEALPFFEMRDFNEELLDEGVSKILSIYHSKGFVDAKVAPIITEKDSLLELKLFIFEGRSIKVGTISFPGSTLNPDRLKEIITLKEGMAYNPEIIEKDTTLIKDLYISLGYLNVEVSAPRVEIKDSKADISFEVSEGSKVFISEILIEGAESFSEDELRGVLTLKESSPYNEVDISNARYKILDFYGSRGFPDVRVDVLREYEEKGLRVIFKIKEGEMTRIGKTIISGNTKTHQRVIAREISYKEGELLDYSLLAKTRRNLYKLGIFKTVSVEGTERYDSTSDIAIKVEEEAPGSVEIGIGYGEYERYRGFFDISYRNLFGLNRVIGLRTELSTLENREILNYYDPRFFEQKLPLRAYFVREERKEKNIDTSEIRYRLRRYSANVGTEKKLTEPLKAELFYEYSLVKTFDVKPDVILTKEDTGTLAISSLRPGLIYDTRDNAFDPRRGFFGGLSTKIASRVLLSETDFIKAILHGSAFHSLSKRAVVAVSLKGGVSRGFRNTEELPLVERFFLGGRSTVRGYEQDTLGPKGSGGTPTGGNAFVLANLELRTYITKNWGVVYFLDGGNVWVKVKDVDITELKYSAGIGIRYNTPVGPLRLDWGYKLDREKGESASEVHFSIGHAF